MKTDEPAATADESRASRGASRTPAPPADTGPAEDPAAPQGVRHDEAVALLHLATRLKAAYPSVDPSVVDQVVATARGSFRQAKVRTYVPILVERRVRALLAGLDGNGAAPRGTAAGDAGAAEPGTAGTAERSAERPRRSPLLGRWIPARLRPAPASASDLGGAGEGP
ncbi:three-helix bundle dimerization domain-containing protein [Streptomyces sp. NPDC021080]|uniref:three-helix bundle dimerization domain-containing protein n=1 Tax=Streptomyces sp. NPDC021080 TaxID=3365110 RepID=UPI0037B707E8